MLVAYASDAIQAHGKLVAGPKLATSSTDGSNPARWLGDYVRRWAYRGKVIIVHKYDTGPGVVAAMKEYGDSIRFGPWPLWLTEFGAASVGDVYRAQILTDVYQAMAAHVEPKWNRTFFFALFNGIQGDSTYEIVHEMFTSTPRRMLGYYCFSALAAGQTPATACQ